MHSYMQCCCAAQAVPHDAHARPGGLATVDEDRFEPGVDGAGGRKQAAKRARPRGRRAGRQAKQRASDEPHRPLRAGRRGCHEPPPAMVRYLACLSVTSAPTWS